jgi:hypothetical protein
VLRVGLRGEGGGAVGGRGGWFARGRVGREGGEGEGRGESGGHAREREMGTRSNASPGLKVLVRRSSSSVRVSWSVHTRVTSRGTQTG